MRVCLLTSQDLDADPFPEDDWPCDPRPFLPEADWHVATLVKRTAVRDVTRLAEDGFDLFFNLCDGAADEKTPGIEVVETLEALRGSRPRHTSWPATRTTSSAPPRNCGSRFS